MPTDDAVLSGIHTTVEVDGDRMEFPALDYDYLTFEQVKDQLRELQREYELSAFYILESTPCKYHAVCFTLLEPDTVSDIIEDSDSDVGHKKIREERGNATIRVSEKRSWDRPPRLVSMVPSPYPRREDEGLRHTYFKLLRGETGESVDIVDFDNLEAER